MFVILNGLAFSDSSGFLGVLQAPESTSILKELFDFIKDAGPALKIVILLLAAPIWYPVARVIMGEINEVLAPEGGLFARKPRRAMHPRSPGDDPFLNVPLASHRRDMQGAPGGAIDRKARPRAAPTTPGFTGRSRTTAKTKRSGF